MDVVVGARGFPVGPAGCMVCGARDREMVTLIWERGIAPWQVCADAAACRTRAGDTAPL